VSPLAACYDCKTLDRCVDDGCAQAKAREILEHGYRVGIGGELRAFIEERIRRRGGV